MKKFNPQKTENVRTEYWAVTKDGSKRQKLRDTKEVRKAIDTGKATFWYEYVEGVRKFEYFEFECDVYGKTITTLTQWDKLN